MNSINSVNSFNQNYQNAKVSEENKPSQKAISDSVTLSDGKGGKLDEFIPGELIVRFKGAAPQNLLSAKGADDFSLIKKFDLQNTNAIVAPDKGDLCHVKLNGISVEDALAKLSKDDSIAYAEPNYVINVPKDQDAKTGIGSGSFTHQADSKEPNDLHQKLWGLKNEGQTGGKAGADIDADKAWAITTGKKEGGPLIAVIDTGVDYNHTDLKNNIWINKGEIAGDGIDNDGNGYVDDVHGYSFYSNNGNPIDTQGHGTHCSGTIAAEGNNAQGITGVNWEATMMGVQFLGSNGGSTAGAIDSVIYATKMGADIASNSWGGGGFSQALHDAISEFPGLFIAAAGNSSTNNDLRPHYPSSYDLPNVLAVASTDHNDKISSFSCYGKESVDIAAPGSDIYSTIPGGGYASKSGTSMATPHVSGVAALVMSQFPELSALEVKEAILRGGDVVEGLEDKVATGMRLNAYGALQVAAEIQERKASAKE